MAGCRGTLAARRQVLALLAVTSVGLAAGLGGCALAAPALPRAPQRAPVALSLVVGDAYCQRVPFHGDARSLVTVADPALRQWADAATATLDGRVTLQLNVADEGFGGGLWRYATQPASSWPDTDQSLYFCTHAMLWRLRNGGVVADLASHVARERSLANGVLHPDGLAALRWGGTLVGLPVALWPALMAMDARLPAPPRHNHRGRRPAQRL